ncbi:hypothetical protein [Idiomarina xiamenensis]|uniref:Uncharacterized protein n=1 Tax=Idiomarina xiamenensis 10-D-4 TaxID=740709 RepID=K2KC83_9GAMM|nr:hypothetical protein [Idiomarina xiamenensis]EKE84212.1 hypothetical protein A10D4_05941 [Idiomarina xiamenensis 10-D-4]
MLQLVKTDLLHLQKLQQQGYSLQQRLQRWAVNEPLPQTVAQQCCQCQQPHQARQHRVVRSAPGRFVLQPSAQQWPRPLPDDLIELSFCDGWFYLSLSSPLRQIFEYLEADQLPWLCPRCAGYQGASNRYAPQATLLHDNGRLGFASYLVEYLKQSDDARLTAAG